MAKFLFLNVEPITEQLPRVMKLQATYRHSQHATMQPDNQLVNDVVFWSTVFSTWALKVSETDTMRSVGL